MFFLNLVCNIEAVINYIIFIGFHYAECINPLGGWGGKKDRSMGSWGQTPLCRYTFLRNTFGILSIRF